MSFVEGESRFPVSEEAERIIVGLMLVDRDRLQEIRERGLDKLIWTPFLREVVAACNAVSERGGVADLITAIDELKARKALGEAGIAPVTALTEIPFRAITTLDPYEEVLRDAANKRRALQVAQYITATVLDGETRPDVVLDQARTMLVDDTASSNGIVTSEEAVEAALMRLRRNWRGEVSWIETGLPDLDKLIVGVEPGEMVLLAAPPREGKTTFALNLLLNIFKAKPERVAALVSLEMPLNTLQSKLVSVLSRVSYTRIRDGRFEDDKERTRVLEAFGNLATYNLDYIEPTKGTIAEIVQKASAIKRKRGRLDFLVVDYLQLLTPENGKSGRAEQVQATARALKKAAIVLNVPILAISSLSRRSETEKREPVLSDLLYGGEYDADQVWFLYNPQLADSPSERWLLARKVRLGEPGCARLGFRPDMSWFFSLSAPEQPVELTYEQVMSRVKQTEMNFNENPDEQEDSDWV